MVTIYHINLFVFLYVKVNCEEICVATPIFLNGFNTPCKDILFLRGPNLAQKLCI